MATIAEKLSALAILDTFNRVEKPLAGEWKLLTPDLLTGECRTATGPGWCATTGFTTDNDGAYWSKGTLSVSGSDSMAAIFKITRVPTNASRWTGVWLARPSPAVQSGYFLRLEKKSSSNILFTIERWTEGVGEVIAFVETSTYKVGSRIALVVGEGKVRMFASKEAESAFEEKLTVSDSTYTNGYAAIEARGTGEFIIGNYANGVLAGAPDAITGSATGVTTTTATLLGQVDPNRADTDYYFEYGTTTGYGTKVPPTEDGEAGSGDTAVSVEAGLTGLTPGTTYHYRLVAKNFAGEDQGEDKTFTADSEEEGAVTVKVRVGGVAKDVKRWVKTPGGLVNA